MVDYTWAPDWPSPVFARAPVASIQYSSMIRQCKHSAMATPKTEVRRVCGPVDGFTSHCADCDLSAHVDLQITKFGPAEAENSLSLDWATDDIWSMEGIIFYDNKARLHCTAPTSRRAGQNRSDIDHLDSVRKAPVDGNASPLN